MYHRHPFFVRILILGLLAAGLGPAPAWGIQYTAFIMVILMASTANFDAAIQQYEAIIEKNISFGAK